MDEQMMRIGVPFGAKLSPDELYRYRLWRTVGSGNREIAFLMLNPSTADARQDDPTIRRCIAFARKWGFGRLEILNLFAFRSPNPKDLEIAYRPCDDGQGGEGTVWDPVGPLNDKYILEVAHRVERIIAAWGVHGAKWGRDKEVQQMLWDYRLDKKLYCLEKTKHNHPRHPLYVRSDVEVIPYRGLDHVTDS